MRLEGDVCMPMETTGEPTEVIPTAVSTPFYVDDYFAPAYMGDGEVMGALQLTDECPASPSEANTTCHAFVYTPASRNWAGAYWLFPADNWGVRPGLDVAAGADSVSVWAWTETGTQTIKLIAGGVGFGVERPLAYPDGFKVEQEFLITSTPTEMVLDLDGATYEEGVVGAFAWAMAAPESGATVTFYLAGIRWNGAGE
jgi:hypothetical protein